MNWRTFTISLVLVWLLFSLALSRFARTGGSLAAPFDVPRNLANSKTILVPDNFEKIQDAINNATEGSWVLVKSGIYYENIVVNKSVSLIGESRSNTIIDANMCSHVVTILANNVLISGFTLRNGGMSFPSYYGINVYNVDNSYIINNTIIGNFVGIKLGDKLRGAFGHMIRDNNITKNRYGIFLDHSNSNIIYGNIVSENKWNGIELAWCERNVICANTISANKAYGLEIYVSTPARYNVIYNNNFINNTFRTSVSGYVNVWDGGYPSGGNYWSDYDGMDSNFDGIGDTLYFIDENNQDNYPLMGMFSSFNTSYGYAVSFISNSSISDVSFSLSPIEVYPPEAILAFNVSGVTDTEGFVRICIPKILINSSYVVRFNGEIMTDTTYPQVKELPCSNETHVYFYINYTHSEHTIDISGITAIPEFPSFLILPLFMIATLLAVIIYRKKRIR